MYEFLIILYYWRDRDSYDSIELRYQGPTMATARDWLYEWANAHDKKIKAYDIYRLGKVG